MAQQTAVEWLLEQIKNKNGKEFTSYYTEFIDQAKAMEKEQIKNSFNDGYCKGDEELSWDDIEKYYNETYNK
jgi:hypothetical protein